MNEMAQVEAIYTVYTSGKKQRTARPAFRETAAMQKSNGVGA